ncbi:MAG: cytochrome C assembly protein [Acidobacteria bacterium]|nr:cytochrome C assembly protein [Acidobacteriota bacterium]
MREKILYVLGVAATLLLVRNLYVIFITLPDEQDQGAIYRIMFFHIPAWFVCFTAYFLAGVTSVLYLVKKQFKYDVFSVSAVEVGLAFTLIGLATGSIWARIIWGIWWTWDARLTWAFITCLLYAAYLMMRNMMDDASTRARFAAVVCTFAFTSVAITFKAIEWWRTQHPGPVLSLPGRSAGGTMDPEMEAALRLNYLALFVIAGVLIAVRMNQEKRLREVESLRRQVHAM